MASYDVITKEIWKRVNNLQYNAIMWYVQCISNNS